MGRAARHPVGHSGRHGRHGPHAHAVLAELALAAETGGDVDQAVQAAYLAGVEPYEIAELGGLPMRRVLETVGLLEG